MGNSDHSDAAEAQRTVRAGRAALLDLLADLLLRELDEPLARRIAADPTLLAQLQPPTRASEVHALRGEYARLFLLEVPPYASLYLDDPPLLGGESTVRWQATLARLGYASPTLERAAAPDHAGLALRALAWAERTEDDGAAAIHEERVGVVLATLLRWLPQYLTALGRDAGEAGGAFYSAVAELVGVVVQSCAGDVAPPASLAPAHTTTPLAPPADDDLRSLSRWLATPAQSGWYLSKERLRQLAHRMGVGSGMVERERMLEQAFEASGLDDRTAELLDVLLQEWDGWSLSHAAWASAVASWDHAFEGWRAALEQLHALLTAMRAAVPGEA